MRAYLSKVLSLTVAGWLFAQTAFAAETSQPLSSDGERLYAWVTRSGDNHGLPFMIIDKRRARLWVFDATGSRRGDAPVLLGSARGDHTAPGVGEMKLSEIKAEDRTTPAGRFRAEVGQNLRGEDIVWVDYDAGVSMHPVLTTNAREQRQRRLDTETSDDNRISFGCINVPTQFHAAVVMATVGKGNSIVYILPEARPLDGVFSQLSTRPTRSSADSSDLHR